MPDIICQNCGSINDYRTVMKSNQQTAWCNGCDCFIKNLPQGKPVKLYFGKYKDRLLSSMDGVEEVQYLKWLQKQSWCNNILANQISDHLSKVIICNPNEDWDDVKGVKHNG